MPLIETTGSASAKALGLNSASGPVNYIEDVFSTYLYTGNGSSQTITNGIDLAGKGGLFWVKARAVAGSNGLMYGSGTELCSNSTNGLPASQPYTFGASGITFTGGIWSGFSSPNESGRIYASWTFRKQPKFFDIVTYTGTGVARTIAHNLGSVPGCIIIKRLDDISNWPVYHRSNLANDAMFLSTIDSINISKTYWNNTRPTSTVFSLGDDSIVNQNGGTFVAYLFAHDAGGFGTAGTDNVISCGSFTTNGSGLASVNLGYEPQWVLFKASSTSSNWYILDNMRGLDAVKDQGNALAPNLSNAEFTFDPLLINATGFNVDTAPNPNTTYIYIAIRRGPMKTPTSGTSVYMPIASSDSSTTQITTGFPVDLQWSRTRNVSFNTASIDRLRGVSTTTSEGAQVLQTNTTAAEDASSAYARYWNSTGYTVPSTYGADPSSAIYWNFRRAPGFFDVVCYTGTGNGSAGQNLTLSHNLQAIPEMMLVKRRSPSGTSWWVYHSALGNTKFLQLDQTTGASTATAAWNDTSPTSSQFTVGSYVSVNYTGYTYVAYLFASCPGVSKVGSFTQVAGVDTAVNCGFTSGARFILIKSTTTTSNDDWYVWDSARGITSGTEPYLRLNSANAEVTTSNSIVPNASGFTTSGSWWSAGTYIYLAIA